MVEFRCSGFLNSEWMNTGLNPCRSSRSCRRWRRELLWGKSWKYQLKIEKSPAAWSWTTKSSLDERTTSPISFTTFFWSTCRGEELYLKFENLHPEIFNTGNLKENVTIYTALYYTGSNHKLASFKWNITNFYLTAFIC